MTSEQKIVQYLNEAHALEAALIQTLMAHIAIAPRSEYRDLLERHLEETREQASALLERLGELGESRNPLELVYGIAQTAVGQLVAAGKLPLDLLRGTGGEEKLLKNARDEAASEALEIATYDSIEAIAEAAGDTRTADLARRHREQEEAFLADLRDVIPQLARDVLAAETGEDGPYDLSSTGAADAARGAGRFVRDQAEELADAVAGEDDDEEDDDAPDATADAGDEGGDDEDELPIAGYDDLTVEQVLPKLRLLTSRDLDLIEQHERTTKNRSRILERIGRLRATLGGGVRPARA